MSWQTPFTQWTRNSRVTYTDMNRIAGNLNYLLPSANLKDDYTATDFVTVTEWNNICNALVKLITLANLGLRFSPSIILTYNLFNNIERYTGIIYNTLTLYDLQHVADNYAGDDLYSASAGAYGNTENYVRGF